MEKNLKIQSIKYAKYFSEVLNIPCTVVDMEYKTMEQGTGDAQADICSLCPRRECSGYGQFSKGCEEAYCWDGLYIFYCPQNLVLICASINSENGGLAGGIVLGPIILNSKDNLLDEITDKEYIDFITKVPEVAQGKIQSISELLTAIAGNISRLSSETASKVFYRQNNMFLTMYGKQVETSGDKDPYTYPLLMEGKLRYEIRNRNHNESRIVLNQMLSYIYRSSNRDVTIVKPRVIELGIILTRAAVDAGANVKNVFRIQEEFNEKIGKSDDLNDISASISEMINKLMPLTYEFEYVKHADTINKVIDYINNNLSRHISLDEIADFVYMSKTYLSSLFKKETGYSISEYINDTRVIRSQSLLLASDLSIVEIAHLCGFEDQSYYTKVFKQITNVTPRKYREYRGNKKEE